MRICAHRLIMSGTKQEELWWQTQAFRLGKSCSVHWKKNPFFGVEINSIVKFLKLFTGKRIFLKGDQVFKISIRNHFKIESNWESKSSTRSMKVLKLFKSKPSSIAIWSPSKSLMREGWSLRKLFAHLLLRSISAAPDTILVFFYSFRLKWFIHTRRDIKD